MKELLINSVIIGLITSLLGSVILRIVITGFNKLDNNESLDYILNKYKNNYMIEVALFFTGMLIHLLLEYAGFNKWYCNKKCYKDTCKIVCEKDIGSVIDNSKIGKTLSVPNNIGLTLHNSYNLPTDSKIARALNVASEY